MKLSRRGLLGSSVTGISALILLITTTWYSAAAGTTPSMGEAKFVDIDGIRTRYFEGGEGEVMVLIHGGAFGSTSSSAIVWMPIFASLASHFHVYSVDKLGMGLTDNPRSDSGYSMQATLEHIYRFMETLGIESVHLVGHSRGALPSARIAIDHPEMVRTLTLFDSNTLAPGNPFRPPTELGPAGPPPTKESIRQDLLASDRWFHTDFITDEYVEAQFEVVSHPKQRQALERFEALRKRFVEQNPEKVKARPALSSNSGNGWWMYEVKDETLAMIRAGRLHSPTLVIWGFNDPSATYVMAVDLFQLISKSVDRAQLHFFNQSGHFPYREYPQEVTNLIVGFSGSVKDLSTN